MKKNFKIFQLILLLGLVLGLTACKKPEKLEAPEIHLDETVVSWLGIENSSGYLVTVNDTEYETTSVAFDLKDINATSYEITVKAIGDGKKYEDSDLSNKITVTPTNKVELEKLPTSGSKVSYKLKVQSSAEVLGFVFELSFQDDKLSLTEANVKFSQIVPSGWIKDINIVDGNVTIAITGLSPLNVKLLQTFLTIEFTATDTTGTAKLENYIIDND